MVKADNGEVMKHDETSVWLNIKPVSKYIISLTVNYKHTTHNVHRFCVVVGEVMNVQRQTGIECGCLCVYVRIRVWKELRIRHSVTEWHLKSFLIMLLVCLYS